MPPNRAAVVCEMFFGSFLNFKQKILKNFFISKYIDVVAYTGAFNYI